MPELEKVYSFLKNNPTFGIQISGFADADGTEERNRLISESRSKAVASYLTGKGIITKRVTARGYGQAPEARKDQSELDKKSYRKAEIVMVELTN